MQQEPAIRHSVLFQPKKKKYEEEKLGSPVHMKAQCFLVFHSKRKMSASKDHPVDFMSEYNIVELYFCLKN
jgi:hypothetical protein